jgi:hypothetical protein
MDANLAGLEIVFMEGRDDSNHKLDRIRRGHIRVLEKCIEIK